MTQQERYTRSYKSVLKDSVVHESWLRSGCDNSIQQHHSRNCSYILIKVAGEVAELTKDALHSWAQTYSFGVKGQDSYILVTVDEVSSALNLSFPI